ncbi:MAG: pyridoxamine 5'-phosphate oxidase family protein [Lentihominibacter sp.]|nr:pyridoxamine 5'-phosphate oxidase family protein [Lentihominibacter sp.]
MFREMRRKKQKLTEERTIEVLNRCTAGTLAVIGDGGYPYSVPLSYVYDGGKIYFHCASEGHKLDAINKDSRVSFSVIDKDQIVQEKYTTYFRSVIVFGKAHVIEYQDAKRTALEKLALKYSPDYREGIADEIDGSFKAVRMVQIDIEHMTGKEAIELVNAGTAD